MSRVELPSQQDSFPTSEQKLAQFERFLPPTLQSINKLSEQTLLMVEKEPEKILEAREINRFAEMLQEAVVTRLLHGLDLSRLQITVPRHTQEFIASVLIDPTKAPIEYDPRRLPREKARVFYSPLYIPEFFMEATAVARPLKPEFRWQRKVVGKGLLPKPLKTL